jgi:DNA invertase Pin-like site-specific DNA recombinase
MKENIIYIRTSTDDQCPENQLNDIKSIMPDEILSSNDYDLVKDQQSAWKDVARTGFNLIKDNLKHNIKNIFVWDLDRLFRNRKKLISFMQLCKAYNVKVFSYRQKFLEDLNKAPSPWNEIMIDLMLQIMGWMAEDESKKKSERIKASIRKRNGKSVSYNGLKWGRSGFSKQTIDRVLKLKQDNPDWSIRKIADQSYYYDKSHNKIKMSKSAVHKILTQNTT